MPTRAGTASGSTVTILGAGLAGLSAAQKLRAAGCAVEVYEKNAYAGGRAQSHAYDGFLFDEGPHVSFTRRSEIRDLLAHAVAGQFVECRTRLLNYWQGYWVRHPAQCHLYGLPVEVVEQCVVDLIKARYEPERVPDSYADWCYQGLGRAFSETFTFAYTRKYWTTEASNMSVDWVGARMYPPKVEEVIHGALTPDAGGYHYLSSFRYPLSGGFAAYVKAVAAGQQVHLNHEVVGVDPQQRQLTFANGKQAYYERLISSLPLPALIGKIRDVPAAVREAAAGLSHTSCVLVNLGVRRDTGFPDAHWMYFYDEDLIFARVTCPHLLSPRMAPPGCGSLQAEVYYSSYKPLLCTDVLNRTIEDLRRARLLLSDDEILCAVAQPVHYANILFDRRRERELAVVQRYLAEQGILGCGRYGEWAYYWSDDSIISGWRAADRIVGRSIA